jgi:spore coat polysaccharide biosynthesis protein SpsF
MRTTALIQARMGSSRLPGKVLEPLAGAPAIVRIAERVQAGAGIDEVAVVTSDRPRDDVVAEACRQAGIPCLRGSEHDVLDRYRQAALALRAERVVRITADCPLIDPEVLGELLALADAHADTVYASVATGAIPASSGYRRYPDGLDAETFTADVLETAWAEARAPFEREHVTPFVWQQPERFPAAVLEAETDLGSERWTVDYPADLELVREVYARLHAPGRPFGYRDVLALLDGDPLLRELNAAHRATD